MFKAAAVVFVVAFSVISFGLSAFSFSLNFDGMDVYPVDSNDIHNSYTIETTEDITLEIVSPQ